MHSQSTDSKHISCQKVDVQSDLHLSSPQDVVSSVISGPFPTNETKEKCTDLAKYLNYTYIGVMGEYCVSVDNFKEDHNSAPVYDQCKDGNGKYNPSSSIQYMDVYRITSSEMQHPDTVSITSAPPGTSGALPKMGSAVSYVAGLFITLVLATVG